MNSIIQMVCKHKSKKFKFLGILNGCNYEILVCKVCRHDADLRDFSETPISNLDISHSKRTTK